MPDSTTGQHSPANDVATLAPEQSLRIGGEVITVRPFGFLEGVSLQAIVAPIVNDLADMAETRPPLAGFAGEHGEAEGEAGPDPDQSTDLDHLDHIFATHIDTLVTLMALVTGKPEDWVRGLDDASGQALLLTFWTVNRDFFTRRLLSRAVLRRHARARQNWSAH